MSNTIEIQVNGVKYTGWTNITVTKSLTDFCGTFSFTGTNIPNESYPIKRGAAVLISVNNINVINGYIDKISVDYSANSHDVSVSGRDRTADIVDSRLGSEFPNKAPISLIDLTYEVLDKLNLAPFMNVSSPYQLDDFKTTDKPEVGVTAFEFLQRNARKRQVLMTTDFDGNIVYDRASETTYNTILSTLPGDPRVIKSSSVTFDDTKRFNFYKLSGQTDDTTNIFEKVPVVNKKSVSSKGTATDSDIRNSRIYYYSSEDTSNDKDGTDRTQWEADYRKAHAFTYSVTTFGFSPINDKGEIWRPNRLARINDIAAGMNTTLLITDVTFTQSSDPNGGSQTKLDFVSRDSFMLQTRKFKHKRQKSESSDGENIFG